MTNGGEISRKTLDRLRNFSQRLESGEPILARDVTVKQTPDGMLTTYREVDLIDELYTDYGGEGGDA